MYLHCQHRVLVDHVLLLICFLALGPDVASLFSGRRVLDGSIPYSNLPHLLRPVARVVAKTVAVASH